MDKRKDKKTVSTRNCYTTQVLNGRHAILKNGQIMTIQAAVIELNRTAPDGDKLVQFK